MNWQGSIVRVWDGLPSNGGIFIGTAFFIDSRTLLTAKHVVENIQHNIYLDGTPGGGKEKIEPENITLCERDIAVLKSSRSFTSVLNLNVLNTEIKVGQKLTLAGYIDEIQSLHTLTSEVSGHVSNLHTWRTQGNISRGMSGGPVIDINDNVVGLIQARDTDKNLCYLIPSEVITSCLEKTGLLTSIKKAPLYNVPKLPPHFINRSEHIEKIKELLLKESGRNVGITGISHTIGLQGMGGIGKSILAASIAYDREIRNAFYDGIIWVTIGQNPDIINLQSIILEQLDASGIIFDDPEHGRTLLSNHLRDKKILLILDDVWKINDVYYFDISSIESKVVITSRHSQVLRGVSAEEYKIDVLPPNQAKQLLRIQSGWEKDNMPEEAELILNECGALPLAISMIGSMLRNRPQNRWQLILRHLRNAELQSIRHQFKDYPYPDLFIALHVSLEAQPAIIQNIYLSLAIFPQDIPIPESVLEIYWNKEDLQHYDVLEIIDELLDASLIFRYNENNLILHDLQNDYIRLQCSDIQTYHRKIVAGYEKNYPLGWSTIPYETPWYFHNRIVYHLIQMGDLERTKAIIEKILSEKNFLTWKDILICSQIINKTPKELARQAIKTNLQPSTLIECIKLLKNEAKDEALQLLRQDNQHQYVITTCLNLLGAEAKDEARRLLKQDNLHPYIITACLKLLGAEAKDEARRLLKQDDQNQQVITSCLNLLGVEAKDEARRLLKQDNQHTYIITTCLKLLGVEAKDEARRLLTQGDKNYQVITTCLKLLGAEAKDEARRLLKQDDQHTIIITACLNLLGVEAKDEARRLLKQDNQYKEVITTCLKLLGAEAKDEARRLLKQDDQFQDVITTCLNLLGAEAKDEARRLLKQDNQYKEVITTCLNLLGVEAKDEARRLLKQDDKNQQVITTCLNLLGVEAKDEARRLLKQDDQSQEVITACLNLLGAEAKDEARRLLKQGDKNNQVITTCLNLLGVEAKDEARRLLKQDDQFQDVITTCLKLLGTEANDEARRLLKQDNQYQEVIMACLNLLGTEAKDEARRLLKQDDQFQDVITECLSILGDEAKEDAKRLLKQGNQNPSVIISCLDILGIESSGFVTKELISGNWDNLTGPLKIKILSIPIKEKIREQKAMEILTKYYLYQRSLVKTALDVFNKDYQKVKKTCLEILQKWESDYDYYQKKGSPKYSGHIIKAMRHPELRNQAKLVAIEVLNKHEEKPGYLDEELPEFCQYFVEGVEFDWTDEM
ncbi:MAG TPA: NB-ARC domain-containing protein [Anaerolineales bacterium]|nr:NB-ARC domain-containing protein [Anaerolineales bacterium]